MKPWLLLLAAVALGACSTTSVGCAAPKPAPVTPAGQASCDQACMNAVAISCGLSSTFCRRVCNGIAAHNAAWATCVYKARSCADINVCSGDDGDGSSTNGPGSGRSGP